MIGKTSTTRMQIEMPKICARCGEQPANNTWLIRSQHNNTFLIVAMTYKTSSFLVPVCDSCKMSLNRERNTSRNVFFASLVGILVFLLSATVFPSYFWVLTGLSFVSGIIFIFSAFLRGKYEGTSGIGNFDGKYFMFFNDAFHRVFSDLNPQYVRTNNR